MIKWCYKCDAEKTHEAFHKNAARKDGLDTLCKDCRKVAVKSYRQTPAGREMQRGVRERFTGKNPKWWDKYNHTDEAKAARAAYEQTEKAKAYRRKQEGVRRTRWLGQWVEDVDRDTVWARDRGLCRLCTYPAEVTNWHLEHLTPIARGGEHSYANTAVSHPACNLSKGTRTFEEWNIKMREVI